MQLDVDATGRTHLILNEDETMAWANRPGDRWPASVLAGKRLWAEFESNGDLCDYEVRSAEGEHLEIDVPSDEFNAITTDHLLPGHPARRNVPDGECEALHEFTCPEGAEVREFVTGEAIRPGEPITVCPRHVDNLPTGAVFTGTTYEGHGTMRCDYCGDVLYNG